MKFLFEKIDKSPFWSQFIPLATTPFVLALIIGLLYGILYILNLLPTSEKISLELRPIDVIVGITIYLKTAIDFAIFIVASCIECIIIII